VVRCVRATPSSHAEGSAKRAVSSRHATPAARSSPGAAKRRCAPAKARDAQRSSAFCDSAAARAVLAPVLTQAVQV